MNEPKPLRKRSEVGRIAAPSIQTFPAPEAPVPSPMENISEFVLELKAQGIDVSLVTAAQWGPAARKEVTEWLRVDGSAMPAVIRALVTEAIPTTKEMEKSGEVPATFADFPPRAHVDLPVVAKPYEAPPARTIPMPAQSSPAVEPMVSDSPDYNRLVTTILKEMDLDTEYEELENALEVGDNRRDYATVYEALDKAERRALRAHALWANAKIEHEKLKLDQDEVNATLWKQAKAALEAAPADEEDEEEVIEEGKKPKKKAPKRRKMITIGDVEAEIATMFPDEWRGGKLRVEKSKVTVERCERFADLWSQKVRSLNTMVGNVRR